MKFKNIAVGFAVGVTGGMLVSLLNAPKPGSELQQSLKNESGNFKSQMDQLKVEAGEVKSSFLKTKHESQEVFSSLGDEIKTMINNFQADINPNIENIQGHIENVSNRGEEISKDVDNMINRKKK